MKFFGNLEKIPEKYADENLWRTQIPKSSFEDIKFMENSKVHELHSEL